MPSVEACEYHQPVLGLDYNGYLGITPMNGTLEISRKWHLRDWLEESQVSEYMGRR